MTCLGRGEGVLDQEAPNTTTRAWSSCLDDDHRGCLAWLADSRPDVLRDKTHDDDAHLAARILRIRRSTPAKHPTRARCLCQRQGRPEALEVVGPKNKAHVSASDNTGDPGGWEREENYCWVKKSDARRMFSAAEGSLMLSVGASSRYPAIFVFETCHGYQFACPGCG